MIYILWASFSIELYRSLKKIYVLQILLWIFSKCFLNFNKLFNRNSKYVILVMNSIFSSQTGNFKLFRFVSIFYILLLSCFSFHEITFNLFVFIYLSTFVINSFILFNALSQYVQACIQANCHQQTNFRIHSQYVD